MSTRNPAVTLIKTEDTESLARRYSEISSEIKALEAQGKALNGELKARAAAEGGSLRAGHYSVKVIKSRRANFGLKDALQVLDEAILAPFISHSDVVSLQVKLFATEEEAEIALASADLVAEGVG